MTTLNEEQTQELTAALQGMSEEESVQHEEEYATEAETPEEEASFEEEGEEYEEEEAEETEDEEGHSVPYGRFSKVIAARNSATAEAEELREEVEAMQAQVEQMRQFQQMMGQQPQEQQADDPQQEDHGDMDPRMARMQHQMQEMAVQQEELALEKEMALVAVEYPGVDSEMLLNAVIQDPEADLMSIAEAYSVRLAEIEEGAVDRYLASIDLTSDAEDEGIPPEVARSGGARRTVTSAAGNKPRTMEEAHGALTQWLQNN